MFLADVRAPRVLHVLEQVLAGQTDLLRSGESKRTSFVMYSFQEQAQGYPTEVFNWAALLPHNTWIWK